MNDNEKRKHDIALFTALVLSIKNENFKPYNFFEDYEDTCNHISLHDLPEL